MINIHELLREAATYMQRSDPEFASKLEAAAAVSEGWQLEAKDKRIKELEEALTAISTNTLDAARAKQVADEVLYTTFSGKQGGLSENIITEIVPVDHIRAMWAASGDALVARKVCGVHHDDVSSTVWQTMLAAAPEVGE